MPARLAAILQAGGFPCHQTTYGCGHDGLLSVRLHGPLCQGRHRCASSKASNYVLGMYRVVNAVWRATQVSRLPVKFPAKLEGDGEEVVISVRAARTPVHNHAPTSKAARMAMSPHRAGSHAGQAMPAKGRRVQHMAVVVEGALCSLQSCDGCISALLLPAGPVWDLLH